MKEAGPTPVVYLKRGCPFCMKVRLFLLEANLLSRVELRAFDTDTDEERSIGQELSAHFDKVTYPAVKLSQDTYINGSDDIVALFAKQWDINLSALDTFQDYSHGVFEHLIRLFQENMTLKSKLG